MQERQVVSVDNFIPRFYQVDLINAIEHDGFKCACVVWARRAGKDVSALNVMLRQAFKRVGVYYYLYPTYDQCRRCIWDSILITGEKFLDFIPKSLIYKKNETQMKITLINGSIIQFNGCDKADSLRGTNPVGVVFSEYSRVKHLQAYDGVIAPILAANQGWVIFISTPYGHNQFFDIMNFGLANPKEWFVKCLNVYETGHMTPEALAREKARLSEELFEQEYMVSFDVANTGSYFAKYVKRAREDGRVGHISYDSTLPVHTAWDLGYSSTVIIFFQVMNRNIYIIDYYENSNEDLSHYMSILHAYRDENNYIFGQHFLPHDVRKHSLNDGLSRLDILKRLGLKITRIESYSGALDDGIEIVRHSFKHVFFSEAKCKHLLKALETYSRKWDEITKRFFDKPAKSWANDPCFVGDTNILTSNGNVKIKDIVPGMKVITPTGLKRVIKTKKKYVNSLCDVVIGDTVITCTPEHKFFTNRGLATADTLRYTDVVEHYDILRSKIWNNLYGYYSKILDLKGFKKTILSLKMKKRSCLMDIFINCMADIIKDQQLPVTKTAPCIELYGHHVMVKYQQNTIYTIKMIIEKIIQLKILNLLKHQSTIQCIASCLIHGQTLTNAKSGYQRLDQKQLNGIGAMMVENGIDNMQKSHCQYSTILNIVKYVTYAISAMKQNSRSVNIVQTIVNQKVEELLDWILLKDPVAFAKVYLDVISTQKQKHVVKNVHQYHSEKQKAVYDLTVEDDNCYYANNYLVSNCDAFRYVCIASKHVNTGSRSPEEYDKRYAEIMYGSTTTLPRIFQD